MKKLLFLTFVLVLGIMTSCKDNGVDLSDLPDAVSTFISKYYPGAEVSRWTNTGGKCVVYLRNSATLSFDNSKDKNWSSIDGNGGTLPQMLVYDQTPTALYRYIEENGAVNGVYSMSRNSSDYTVVISGFKITYNIASGKITQAPLS